MNTPPLPPDSASAPQPKTKFEISLANGIMTVLAWLVLAGLFFQRGDFSPHAIGGIFGACVGLMLFSAALSFVAFLIGGRSNRAGRIVYAVILLLSLLGQFNQHHQKQREALAAALAKMEQAAADNASAAEAFAASGDPAAFNEAGDKMLDDTQAALNELQAVSSGDEAQLIGIVNEFMQEATPIIVGWRESFGTVSNSGILNFQELVSEESYTSRLALLADYRTKTQTYQAFFAGMVPELEKRLSVMGLDHPLVQQSLTGMKAHNAQQTPIFEPLMLAHLEFADAAEGLLRMLQTESHNWSMDDGQVMLETDALVEQFNDYVDRVQQSEETINRLAVEIVKLGG